MPKRTASQVGRASRRKGKSFERWCARYFTKWTGLKWETTRNSGRTDLKGDIYCVSHPDLPLIVECKHDKQYSVHAMLLPTKKFVETMRYIRLDRLRYEEAYLIIIVKNATGIWLWINMNFFKTINVMKGQGVDIIITRQSGHWTRLQHLVSGKVNGVTFDAGRLEKVGKESKK